MTRLVGVGVGSGRVVGRVARYVEAGPSPALDPAPEHLEEEAARVAPAFLAVAEQIEARAEQAPAEARDILEATAMMAYDPTFHSRCSELVRARRISASRAVMLVSEQIADQFRAAGDYMAARTTDLADLALRVIAHLDGLAPPGLPEPGHPHVLVARDLAPVDTSVLDLTQVLAIVIEEGGPTGHTAIIARSLGLPAVVACPGALELEDGDLIAVDADAGSVTTDLPADTVESVPQIHSVQPLPPGPHALQDGHPVTLGANVGDVASAHRAQELSIPGSGLFRTELLFLSRPLEPTLAEQTTLYRDVFAAFPQGKVVARTLDAGADKPLPFLDLGEEENPALGVRGLRVGVQQPETLQRQLAAFAEAAGATDAEVWVMAPMVATPDEAKWFVEQGRAAGLTTLGAMIELPSAALLAAEILAEVDFVSIGTNDLTQYTMGADRVSGKLAALNTPWQPAVLRLVGMVGAAGAAADKSVGVCGEAAADPVLACVLVGLGVTSLSADPRALVAVHDRLTRVDIATCRAMADAACAAPSADAAREAATRIISAAGTAASGGGDHTSD